jgi:hypothetical protein
MSRRGIRIADLKRGSYPITSPKQDLAPLIPDPFPLKMQRRELFNLEESLRAASKSILSTDAALKREDAHDGRPTLATEVDR